MVFGVFTVFIAALIACAALYAAYVWIDRPPSELLRYAERRLEGHPKLQAVFVPLIHHARLSLDAPGINLATPRHVCLAATAPIPSSTIQSSVTVRSGVTLASPTPTIRVGPRHKLTRVAEAASLAKDGDVIEIERGDYLNDVATWNQNNLTIRAVGGRARMISQGQTAEGKAIWVINGNNVTVENIEFSGVRVADLNGAGIRHQAGKLTIRNSVFKANQIGLVSSNNASAELEIEGSEFCDNGTAENSKQTDPGHQIYVGTIGRFTLRDSYVHQGAFGHLVKSRARETYLFYNRITDEIGGRASYEVEFPNGGLAYVIGNIIQQSTQTDNATIISFGTEGYKWSRNELYLVNNTVIDDLPQGGNILKIKPGAAAIRVINNLLLGHSRLEPTAPGEFLANYTADWSDVALPQREDYRLKMSSKLVGKAVDPGTSNGVVLRPQREYVESLRSVQLTGHRLSPGALQRLAP